MSNITKQIIGEDGPETRGPIERLVYNGSTQSFTKDDWVELAMTALDQAGLKLNEQSKVRALLADMGYGPEEQG